MVSTSGKKDSEDLVSGGRMVLRMFLLFTFKLFLLSLSANIALGMSLAPRVPHGEELKVFPGAKGYGTFTKAGRHGRIIHVKNLNDSGKGSLRDAINTSRPRIIVFDVGGEIKLTSGNLVVSDPFCTIVGQTAPLPGITIVNGGIVVNTHDILIQNLRVRPGDLADYDTDCVSIDGVNAYNIIFDHCSFSWAADENISIYNGAHDITFSRCLVAESLGKGLDVGHGILVGYNSVNISFLGNIFANNKVRNPYIQDNCSAIILNNLIYNIGNSSFVTITYHEAYPSPSLITVEGNVFVKGPNTSYAVGVSANKNINPDTKIHLYDNAYAGKVGAVKSFQVDYRPAWIYDLSPLHSSQVKAIVIVNAGAMPANRDEIDTRIVKEIMAGEGKHPYCVEQNLSDPKCDDADEYLYAMGKVPYLLPTSRPFVESPDPNEDDDGDGYTNIENMFHRMVRKGEGI